ncbi:MAG TPA: ATP-binding protein, partial [Flavisolibacter sp.]|nr:ATP-binding protein [Flavisolibacter sp.]
TSVNLLLNSQFPMFVWWGKDLTAFYNDAYRVIAGEKHPDMLGRSGRQGWAEIWHDLAPLVDSVFSGQSTWSEDQVLMMNRHGYIEETYFTFSYSPILDESGAVGGLFCAVIETTEKVLATRKIQQSERNLRATILQAPVAMSILKGPSFVVEIANERIYEIWGRGADELLHRPIFEGLPEVRHQGLEELLNQVYTTGVPFTASERPVQLPRQDKLETRYLNFVYEPFREGDGTITGILVVGTDVTEQVLSRKKVEASEARANAAIEIARLGTFEINIQQQTIIHSPRNAEILGLDPTKQWPYQTIIDTIHPEDRALRVEALEVAKQTGVLFYEVRVIHADQSIRWVRLNGRYIEQDGQPTIVGTLMDITEEKKAAELLEQKVEERTRELEQANEALVKSNQELARSNTNLEEFAHAASHDMKEPIRKVLTFSDRLRRSLEPRMSETEKQLFDRVESSTQRMGLLVDDLLEFSHISERPLEKEEVNLKTKLERVLSDLELQIEEKGATVKVGHLPVVKGYRRQLQQLFQNLLGNALKYSKPGDAPVITLSSQKVVGKDVADKILPEQWEQCFYLIEVQDNGIGFEQEYAERIFRMFQRLHGKAEYPGTGVGLSIARKVVENHSGYIWAESKPGEGATFKVLLPVK